MSKKSKIIIAVSVCCLLIIAGIVLALILINGNSNKAADNSDYSYNSFSEGFTSVRVTDEATAIEAIDSIASSLGVEDTEAELKVERISSVASDSFYRAQQYYNDIPVYKRSIIVAADIEGFATGLTSNYMPISEEIDTEPKASEDKVIKSIEKSLDIDVDTDIDENDLIIYTLDGSETLAYLITLDTFGEIIVNADTAEIIHFNNISSDVSAPVQSKDGKVTSTGWKNNNGSHHLYNEENKITIFDLKGINSSINEDDYVYVDIRLYGIDTVYSKNNVFDKNALILLNDTIKMSKYYEDLGFSGFDQIHVGMNDSFQKGANARGGSSFVDGKACAFMFFGKKYNYSTKDVAGHEFTHAITKNIVGWSGTSVENAALNEAYSDVFGILMENSKTPDWKLKHLSMTRDLAKPSRHDDYDHTSDMRNVKNPDYYKVSTIFSHAAYLMCNGIDNSKCQRIDTAKFTKMMYLSLQLLQPDANFAQCRNAVELSARIMLRNGELTQKQYNTVVMAFDSVGINCAAFTFNQTVKNQFELSVLNSEQTENVKYNLEIIKYPEVSYGFNNKPAKIKTVLNEKGVWGSKSLNLKDGTYVIRITDYIDSKKSQKPLLIKVVVDNDNPDASDELTVTTDFTSIIVVLLPQGEHNDIYRLLENFKTACNKADISGILDCITPEISDNVRLAFGFIGAFSDVSDKEIMAYISSMINSSKSQENSNFLTSVSIDVDSVAFEYSYAYVYCDFSYVFQGETITLKAMFTCEEQQDIWYINSLEFI